MNSRGGFGGRFQNNFFRPAKQWHIVLRDVERPQTPSDHSATRRLLLGPLHKDDRSTVTLSLLTV